MYSFDILPVNSNIALFSTLPLLLTNRVNVNLKGNIIEYVADNLEFKLSRRLLYSEGNSYSNQIRLLFEEEELNQHSPRRVSILKSGIVDISLLNNFDLSLSGVMLYLQLILLPCILYSLDIFPININLF